MLLFPPLGHLLGLSPHAFGLWAGTAINDTSSVVAASFAYGGDAGAYGIVVKLTRTLTLIPMVIVLAILQARREAPATGRRRLPRCRGGSCRCSCWASSPRPALNSLGLIPGSWHPALSALGTFLITTALAGIGLSLRLADLRRAGPRPLLLGGLLWVAVAAGSLGLQAVTGAF